MNDIKRLFQESIQNRYDFLEKKKAEFLNCEKEKDKARVIIELIQIEPSHLAENWVLDQVIKWLKDFENTKDYLQDAFVSKGLRDTMTKDEREKMAENTFLYFKIKNIAENKQMKEIDAIRNYVIQSEDETLPEQAETAIKQRMKRYKNKLDTRMLPYPYYGKDCCLIDGGTPDERIEFYLKDKPITKGNSVYFADSVISYPTKKATK